ncbi:hypothetical protein [Butyrivibrio sp. INlla21]|uniref:hypothetical protein n=1 Tax=Butyrivibrio sp. INlla21 TaxID=1520811 RepID=UPI0008F0A659|nr:hypothetical protein [Butyrivibrio sp. INlla21]SFU94858.1 hypothetical protein SAMN02910342_02560 [Butyrivibrio sp. INlla21]
MNMNPMMIMQLQQRLGLFQNDHPKVMPFLRAVGENAMQEGTVIAMKVTTAEGKTIESNIKINANDVETMKMLMDMGKQ